MADEFGKDTHYGLTSPKIIKTVDDTPPPKAPEPPKPPIGWENKRPSYEMVRQARK